jgi:mannose-6-phosphate isomerase-like protein (cupin superfamily)
MGGDEYKTIWSSRSSDKSKSWGVERHIGSLSTIQAKILYIEKDKSTSLKYYRTKDEVLYVKEGEILVEYDSEKYHYQEEDTRILKKQILLAGEVLYVQSQCPYKITAIKDSEIFEIGGRQSGDAVKIEEL